MDPGSPLESIEIALLPPEAQAVEGDLYVVIDQLRATTTIATLFAAGLTRLAVLDDQSRARQLAAERGALLLGEVGGLPPEGFDYGNSPLEVKQAPVAGREAVLFTTNGTRALCSVAGRAEVVTGAIANAGSVVATAAGHRRVCLVCAGNDGGQRFSLEDYVAAGTIAAELARRHPGAKLGDAAKLAVAMLAQHEWPPEAMVRESRHAGSIRAIGFEPDIEFSLQRDSSAALPTVVACGPGWAELVDANAR